MAYFANGTDGEEFDELCLEQCPIGAERCPIWGVHMHFNYDQCKPGNEELRECLNLLVSRPEARGVNGLGTPVCMMKTAVDALLQERGLATLTQPEPPAKGGERA
jgi:hypothetical protein